MIMFGFMVNKPLPLKLISPLGLKDISEAYQSALSLTPLYFLLMLSEVIGGGPFFNTLTIICISIRSLGMAYVHQVIDVEYQSNV